MTQRFRFLKLGQAADGTEDESVWQFVTRDFIAGNLVILVPGTNSNWHKSPPGHPDFKSHPALTQHHQEIFRTNTEARVDYMTDQKQLEQYKLIVQVRMA
jgi:hypothetical protein